MEINNFVLLLQKHKVVIPPIQRDYAQGRNTDKVKRIRDSFLDKMADVLSDNYTGKPLKLDFIYGYVNTTENANGVKFSIFKPLDGQQRLTTLFLLHWYVAVREGCLDKNTSNLLAKFSYATRAKSRQFCERLVKFNPESEGTPVTSQIKNQPWFFLSWLNDPTVSSMLVVLEAIESKFNEKNIDRAWGKLTGEEPAIIFYLLEMGDIGLPDDLYIKMNSRGKELTKFEHFKSQFSRIINEEHRQIFNKKIDKEWSDLFWNIFKENTSEDLALDVDSGFLSFFWYITDMLLVKNNIEISNSYWLNMIEAVYCDKQNVEFLFACLELFTDLEKNDPDYFDRVFYEGDGNYECGKTRLFFNTAKVNLFHKCAEAYNSLNRINPFSFGEQLMLYACIIHKLSGTDDFSYNIRKIRNLIASSEDQVRKEYLGSLYEDIENIVRNEEVNKKSRFSKSQFKEEDVKLVLRNKDSDISEVLFELEDHHLLRGTISIFDIDVEIEPYANKFQHIFHEDCDYFKISQAMLTFGDYTQGYGRLRRFGNESISTWRELFTPNDYRKDFNNTKMILKDYLQKFVDSEEMDNDRILIDFPHEAKDWRYYYIHYDSFKKWGGHSTEGFYYWQEYEDKPFECYMMYKRQFNGKHWNPYLLEIKKCNKNCSLENYGDDLQFTCGSVIFMISMENNTFTFRALPDDDVSLDMLDIIKEKKWIDDNNCIVLEQVSNAEDAADRIKTCIDVLEEIEVVCQIR